MFRYCSAFISFLQLLFKLGRPVEVAARGYSFIIGFSKTLALHEVCHEPFVVVVIIVCMFGSPFSVLSSLQVLTFEQFMSS